MHEVAHSSIMRCDVDLRAQLFANIILSGGNTMLEGLAERLSAEIKVLAPFSTKVVVVAPPERQQSVWIGGSILASLPAFQQMWVTQKEYRENGVRVVHRKCF